MSLREISRELKTINQRIEEQQEQNERIDYIQITLPELKKLKFSCGYLAAQHEKCCLSHIVGLPKHPDTLLEMPLTPYQMEFKTIADKNPKRKFHVNKARQTGFSEIVLRIVQERGFKQYSTKSIKYVNGIREKTTKKMMSRLKHLFKRIPDVVEKNSDSLYLELIDGTNFEGLPANAEAVTGDTKIAAVAMDESAKWNKTDDTEVLNAYIPIIDTNKADLFMFSTPKGPRGFFYNLDEGDAADNNYIKYRYNIWATQGNLYTKEAIENMLADNSLDTDQEYLNQYTTGRDSIWGKVTDEHRDDEVEMEL